MGKENAREPVVIHATVERKQDDLPRFAVASASGRIGFLQQFTDFISDGFLFDTGPRSPVGRDRLGRITDEARRAGVVIYTIDARGLISGAPDATGNAATDPDGKLQTANLREIVASQDALNALAADTGGRALRNQNTFLSIWTSLRAAWC